MACLSNTENPPVDIEPKPDERVKIRGILRTERQTLKSTRDITGFDYRSRDHQVSEDKILFFFFSFSILVAESRVEEGLRNPRTRNSKMFPKVFGNC